MLRGPERVTLAMREDRKADWRPAIGELECGRRPYAVPNSALAYRDQARPESETLICQMLLARNAVSTRFYTGLASHDRLPSFRAERPIRANKRSAVLSSAPRPVARASSGVHRGFAQSIRSDDCRRPDAAAEANQRTNGLGSHTTGRSLLVSAGW